MRVFQALTERGFGEVAEGLLSLGDVHAPLFDVVEVEKLGVEYLEQLDKEGVLLYESD